MAKLTKEDLIEWHGKLVEMNTKKGMSLEESSKDAAGFIETSLRDIKAYDDNYSVILSEITGVGKSAGRGGGAVANAAAMFGLPVAGAGAGYTAGAKLAASPAVARTIEKAPGIIRRVGERIVNAAPAVGEGAGFMAGDVAGRAITGTPQDPTATLAGGATAGLMGPAMRGTNRFLAEVGGTESAAVMEAGIPTAGVLPSVQKTMRPAPRNLGQARAGISIERRVRDRTQQALAKASAKTKWRQEKENIIVAAETDGKRVNPFPMLAKMEEEILSIQGQTGKRGTVALNAKSLGMAQGNKEAAANLGKMANELRVKAEQGGGTLSPSEWDAFVRGDLGDMAYTYAGGEKSTHLAAHYRKLRDFGAEEMRRQVIPPDKWHLDEKATQYLLKLDEAERYFGADGNQSIQSVSKVGQKGYDDMTAAMQWLSDTADKGLKNKYYNMKSRRAFTSDIRELPGQEAVGRGGGFVKLGARGVARTAAPFQPWMGGAAGLGGREVGRMMPESVKNPIDAQSMAIIDSVLEMIEGPRRGGLPLQEEPTADPRAPMIGSRP